MELAQGCRILDGLDLPVHCMDQFYSMLGAAHNSDVMCLPVVLPDFTKHQWISMPSCRATGTTILLNSSTYTHPLLPPGHSPSMEDAPCPQQ